MKMMEDNKYDTKYQVSDDEEDLEFLRLQALKTLHMKKKNNLKNGNDLIPNPSNVLRQENSKPHHDHGSKYYPTIPQTGYIPRKINNELTEQYIPPVTANYHSNVGWPDSINNTYMPIIPPYSVTSNTSRLDSISAGVSNVQLSPRSLAFVSQNNNILMRRKGVSPGYRLSRSPSPRWYPASPSSKVRNISRSPRPRSREGHYRSLSRSISPQPKNNQANLYHRSRSPDFRKHKSVSRSPLRQRFGGHRYSRSPPQNKRIKSRTPPKNTHRDRSPISNKNRAISKSPILSRRRSPNDRNENKRSPMRNSPGYEARNRSPIDGKRKSISPNRSRSPVARKYSRKSSRDRNFNSSDSRARRSPKNRRSNNNNRYKNRNNRNPTQMRRSLSPKRHSHERKEQRREIPYLNNRKDINTNTPPLKFSDNEIEHKTENMEPVMKSSDYCTRETLTPPKPAESLTPPIKKIEGGQLEKVIEEETKGFDDQDSESDSSDDDDDGIDLFPSSESESENEARFKSSTTKHQRTKVSTLSFTKLSEASAVPSLKELVDEDESRTRSVRKGYTNSKHRRDNGRNTGSSRRSRTPERRRKSNKVDEEKKNKTDKPMFKSTFQAIENENRLSSKVTDVKKNSRAREDSLEKNRRKKSLTPLLPSTHKQSDNSKMSRNITPETEAKENKNGKKPVHSRLGAMTNTFKSTKKYDSSSPATSDKV